jgi:predicted O-methyltransferase YrrM
MAERKYFMKNKFHDFNVVKLAQGVWNNLIRWVLPYNIVVWLLRRRLKFLHENREKKVQKFRLKRSEKFAYGEAIKFLYDQGCPPSIEPMSVTEISLTYCASFITDLKSDKPLLALQVGTFVGVSLAFFADLIAKIHPNSRIISIDPNIAVAGVGNPYKMAIALLNHFQLEDRCMILTGYSLEKNYMTDGYEGHKEFDPLAHTQQNQSCTEQLKNLTSFASNSFDFIFLDGNHEGEYLERELYLADRLLKKGGLLIIDDVFHFEQIRSIYQSLATTKYEKIGEDERLGVLRKRD